MKAPFAFLTLASVLALVIVACSSSEETTPTRPVRPVDSNPQGDGGSPDGAPVDPGCLGPDSCFKCEPTKLIDFLNACTDGQCVPFDNAARLPLYEPGKPLPAVP